MAEKEKKDKKEKNGGKGKFLILVILIVAVAGAGTFGGVYFYMKSHGSAAEKTVETTSFELSKEGQLINLKDKRYVKVKVTLVYDIKNTKLAEELTTKTPIIKDRIINIFNSKTADEALSNKIAIQKELLKPINAELTKGQIIEVVFDDFVVQ
ncbi:flagellar basal body-associated protein FliL [Clostridium sp. YIM B02551]|uniref:flagellar basal body-associated FliL family protein n=1 Tax=Clostridium sp. YIM B02551 TaxID=2910679 RepID=UPI001EEC5B58|nr:flagellar basal body-associated FliL family protein [Clostridium sp. YIM B02551]